MFIGHFGIALATKKVAPSTALGTLILAAQFMDFIGLHSCCLALSMRESLLVSPAYVPLTSTTTPSHTVCSAVWAVILAGIYHALRRTLRSALVIAAVLLSHWILDFIVHRPDLALLPGGQTRVGLGLWNSLPATVFVEVLFFGGGLLIYLSCTRARDKAGRFGFWTLIFFLFFAWVSTLFVGPPPNVASLAWGGLAMWLTALWGGWADRHRVTRQSL
jgi:hypothetical protein